MCQRFFESLRKGNCFLQSVDLFDFMSRSIQGEWADPEKYFYFVLGGLLLDSKACRGQEVHRRILQWMKFLCCFFNQLLSHAIVIKN